MTTPTLCLNMIVKNESKIITRLLDSVASIIDCYCICDTGSTDDTTTIITDYFNNKNIPGKIMYNPFTNFSNNRNFALNGCVGMSDYILLLDADMILEINNFDKSLLTRFDSFFILQGNDSFYYQNIRIVKNNGLYKYVGVTHEYMELPASNTVNGFSKKDLFIRDLGDGGSKTDKFERDIMLLLNGIKEEPQNVRYYFYLANSYYDLGKFNEAIEMYTKRIDFGGWIQEVWYSYYRIGLCFKNMNNMKDAIYYWLEGYNCYPERLEGLYEIIKFYRVTSKQSLGELFYQQAKKILDLHLNRDEHLFLHNDIYTHKLYYEHTILAAYSGITNINDEIIQILNNCNKEGEINNLLSNMKFYKNTLMQTSKIILDNETLVDINGQIINMKSSSSCLIKNTNNTNNGYALNIRYVNYNIASDGTYSNCDKHIITANKYVEFDENFKIINEKWMDLSFDANKKYIGIEDVKIFNDIETDECIYLGTGLHQNNTLGIISGKYNKTTGDFDSLNEIKQNIKCSSCEKNWVFVDYLSSTHVIYDWYPLQICKIDYTKNTLHLVEQKETPKLFSRIRGSSCGYKYLNSLEIWFVNHLVSYENPRHYYHIISVFDENLHLLRYSAPFKFESEPIEFCLSIVVDAENVLMNYSTWDRTTRIGVYDKKYIESTFYKE